MRSIQRQVLAWALGAMLLGGAVLASVAYRIALHEFNEVLDANLRQVALSIAHLPPVADGDRAPARPALADGDDDLEIIIQTWTPRGERLHGSHGDLALPFTATGGLSRVRAGNVDWDLYTLVRTDRVVQVAQRAAAQQSEAAESTGRLLLLSLVVALLMGALLWFALRRGLRPLGDAAAIVAARSPARLEPVPDDVVPRELRPLVWAINTLMRRLAEALDAQRRFVADAAHALRTPVAALRLQLGLLESATDTAGRQRAQAELRAGVDRSQHLIEQLLQLSRAEPGLVARRMAPMSLQALARDAVARFSARADMRGIDLGALAAEPLWVNGDVAQLAVLLDNLVDNALRYTPSGGVVDVVATRAHGLPVLQVIDSGPGIVPTERGRVLDRFYRGDAARSDAHGEVGSGLGLAIAKAIADANDADLSLGDPVSGAGLSVSLAFRAEVAAPEPGASA